MLARFACFDNSLILRGAYRKMIRTNHANIYDISTLIGTVSKCFLWTAKKTKKLRTATHLRSITGVGKVIKISVLTLPHHKARKKRAIYVCQWWYNFRFCGLAWKKKKGKKLRKSFFSLHQISECAFEMRIRKEAWIKKAAVRFFMTETVCNDRMTRIGHIN